MKYENLMKTILICLEEFRKQEQTKEQKWMLQNLIKEFCNRKNVYTDGEDIADVVSGVVSDLTIWVKESKGILVQKEVERQLTNMAQKVKDRAKKIRKRQATLEEAPLMKLIERGNTEAEYEETDLVRKAWANGGVKSAQSFWKIIEEMQHRTEPEWLYMKRLPFDDPLWFFLGTVGMKNFSFFFYKFRGCVFKIPNDYKVDKLISQPPIEFTKKEIVKQVNKWYAMKTYHEMLK